MKFWKTTYDEETEDNKKNYLCNSRDYIYLYILKCQITKKKKLKRPGFFNNFFIRSPAKYGMKATLTLLFTFDYEEN